MIMRLIPLIQSLTENEKRYFRMYAQLNTKGGGKAKYMELFEELVSSKDPALAQKTLKKKTYSAANQNFLTEKILESLRMHHFHIIKNPVLEIKENIAYLSILLKKRLLKDIPRRIRKIKQEVKQYELFNEHLTLLQIEKRFLWREGAKDFETKLLQLQEEEKQVTQQLTQVLAYQQIQDQLTLLRRKDMRLKQKIHQDKLLELIQHPLLKEYQNNLLSTTAQIHYHFIQSIAHRYHQSSPPNAFHHAQQIIQLYDAHPPLKSLHPQAHKSALCLFSEMAYWSNHFAEMQVIISKIEQLAVKNGDLGVDILNTACFYGLLCAINTRDYKEGTRIIKVIEKYWTSLSPTLKYSRQLAFFYNTFLFYWLFEEWDKANPYLNNILLFKRVAERKDIQCVARIWKLVLAYETGSDRLGTDIESGEKYLKRQSNYGDFEKTTIQAFKRLDKVIDKAKKQAILQQLQNDLTALIEAKKGQQLPLGLQEMRLWVGRKV